MSGRCSGISVYGCGPDRDDLVRVVEVARLLHERARDVDEVAFPEDPGAPERVALLLLRKLQAVRHGRDDVAREAHAAVERPPARRKRPGVREAEAPRRVVVLLRVRDVDRRQVRAELARPAEADGLALVVVRGERERARRARLAGGGRRHVDGRIAARRRRARDRVEREEEVERPPRCAEVLVNVDDRVDDLRPASALLVVEELRVDLGLRVRVSRGESARSRREPRKGGASPPAERAPARTRSAPSVAATAASRRPAVARGRFLARVDVLPQHVRERIPVEIHDRVGEVAALPRLDRAGRLEARHAHAGAAVERPSREERRDRGLDLLVDRRSSRPRTGRDPALAVEEEASSASRRRRTRRPPGRRRRARSGTHRHGVEERDDRVAFVSSVSPTTLQSPRRTSPEGRRGGEARPARDAPRRPEVEDDDVPPEGLERERRLRPSRRCTAGAGSAPRAGGAKSARTANAAGRRRFNTALLMGGAAMQERYPDAASQDWDASRKVGTPPPSRVNSLRSDSTRVRRKGHRPCFDRLPPCR